MGRRIKVTGYLNVDDLTPEEVDLAHETGLSETGYEEISVNLCLEDVEFVLLPEGE